ncbi:MAG: apolipoprotein N-acyltransferase, partial [Lentisphaeria bacterium]|nr:apolipoprotein N-acyltransferase [Lentisphaeria bacterium]
MTIEHKTELPADRRPVWKRTLSEVIILSLSGAGMTLAYPPANIDFFAWICVIPLLWITLNTSVKRAFLYGLLWGYMWHVTGTFFLREIFFFIPFVFAVVLGLFNAAFAMAVPWLAKNLLYPESVRKGDFEERRKFYLFPVWGELVMTLTLAGLWVVLEWVRSWIFTGFPWNLLGTSLWQNYSLIQICEYTGVYGLSFLIILINIAGFFAIRGLRFSLPEGKYRRPYPLIGSIVLLIVLNSAGANLAAKAEKQAYTPFAVGVVQPHLSQRRAGGGRESAEALSVCENLTRDLIATEQLNRTSPVTAPDTDDRKPLTPAELETQKFRFPLRLTVWPESAVPRTYYGYRDYEEFCAKNPGKVFRPPFEATYRKTVRDLLAAYPEGRILLGTITYDQTGALYNSALLLKHASPDLKTFNYDQEDVYSKVHIVPFGEFVPLAKEFPVLDKWLGMGRSLDPGKSFRPLPVGDPFRAGILICYEDVFAYTARELARNKADFLLVITNDAWYPTSSEPEQHYINAIFRTVETRLPMVRAGNSNYSVLISPTGRLIDCITKRYNNDGSVVFDPGRKVSGSAKFIVPVPLDPVMTFYTMYGDVFVLLCGFFLMTGFGIAGYRAYRFAHLLHDALAAERERIRAEFLASGDRK